ncbi:hypothetical protein [Paenibacillus illinoisensis]|uniref:hypothetical protein n=1 Tax=Paenibacillus illinoisensis TaxID=59845 RepID=UPI003CF4BE9C
MLCDGGCGSACLPGSPLIAKSRPSLRATITGRASLSARLPAPLREGRELAPGAGGQGFALCPAPCSASRRAGACACGWWAGLRPLPGAPCSASRRAGAFACGWRAGLRPLPRAPCSAPRRAGACACGA